MKKTKKTILICSTNFELKWAKGKAYDQILLVNEIGALLPMLKAGDKVVIYDINTVLLSLDYLVTFLEWARRNGVAFESISQSYLCFSPSRPLPYKITNYLLDMQKFRNELWNMRRVHGINNDNTPQAREYYRQCDLIVKRAISITLATEGILKK